MIENEKELSNIRNIIIMINKIPLIPPNKESANSFYKVLSDIHQKNPKFILLQSYRNELMKRFGLDSENKDNNAKSENENNKGGGDNKDTHP